MYIAIPNGYCHGCISRTIKHFKVQSWARTNSKLLNKNVIKITSSSRTRRSWELYSKSKTKHYRKAESSSHTKHNYAYINIQRSLYRPLPRNEYNHKKSTRSHAWTRKKILQRIKERITCI